MIFHMRIKSYHSMSPTHLLDALFLYLPLLEILSHERERESTPLLDLSQFHQLHRYPDKKKGRKPEHGIKQAIREEARREELTLLAGEEGDVDELQGDINAERGPAGDGRAEEDGGGAHPEEGGIDIEGECSGGEEKQLVH
jgi:hypothetical protein